jgi:acyl-CoA reductase-like NAD-dependent aldehyde dehydrogenase
MSNKIVYKSKDPDDLTDLFIGPYIARLNKEELFGYDEVFGPILLVVGVKSFEESIEIVKRNEKCLSLYIFTDDQPKIDRLVQSTSSGAVTINDTVRHFAVPTLPFGGVGNSGMGSYHGRFGFDTFTHKKAILKLQI